jgi:paraquat-inducible protein A
VSEEFVACDDCDLIHRIPVGVEGRSGRCVRCGGVLFNTKRNTVERTLALAIAGMVLFLVANVFPFLSFEMQGRVTETTLLSGIQELWREDMGSLAGLVLFTAVLAPGLQLCLLLYVLVPLHFDRVPWKLALFFRTLRHLATWSMMEVFLIGILVALVKLGDMAEIVPGLAIYSFAILILVLAGAAAALDPRTIWRHVPVSS